MVDKVSEEGVFNSFRETDLRHENHEIPQILTSTFNNTHVDALPFN
jgi:hypothetical protein